MDVPSAILGLVAGILLTIGMRWLVKHLGNKIDDWLGPID